MGRGDLDSPWGDKDPACPFAGFEQGPSSVARSSSGVPPGASAGLTSPAGLGDCVLIDGTRG